MVYKWNDTQWIENQTTIFDATILIETLNFDNITGGIDTPGNNTLLITSFITSN